MKATKVKARHQKLRGSARVSKIPKSTQEEIASGGKMSEAVDVHKIQSALDSAFADFKSQNPVLAQALESLNISYAEYLQRQLALSYGTQTTSGNASNS
jgi:hypothetical protein